MSSHSAQDSQARMKAISLASGGPDHAGAPTGANSQKNNLSRVSLAIPVAEPIADLARENNAAFQRSFPGQEREGTGRANFLELAHPSMVRLIDGLFDLMQIYATEINHGTGGSELELTCFPPQAIKDLSSGHAAFYPVILGRLSTRFWTLIVKGSCYTIEAFVLPAEELLKFNANASTIKPYMQLNSRQENTKVQWTVDEAIINEDHIGLITKHLMETLMNCACNRPLNPDGFSETVLGIKEQQLSEAEMQAYREQFFADFEEDLEALEILEEERMRSAKAQRELDQETGDRHQSAQITLAQGVHGKEQRALSEAETQDSLPGLNSSVRFNGAESLHGDSQASPALETDSQVLESHGVIDEAELQMTQPELTAKLSAEIEAFEKTIAEAETERRQRETGESPIEDGISTLSENEVISQPIPNDALTSAPASPMKRKVNLPKALGILLEALDLELEAVSQAGAEAFNKRDFTRAQVILEFTNRLTDFRQSAKQLYDDYS
jgi:hypothetical protein